MDTTTKMIGTKEVAKIMGVSAATVANWHKKGSFVADYVTPTGRLFYSFARVTEARNGKHHDRDVKTGT